MLVYLGTDLLAAGGLNVEFGGAGVVNFAYIVLVAAGAYLYAVFTLGPPAAMGGFQQYIIGARLPVAAAVALAAAICGILGCLIGVTGLKRLRADYQAMVMLVISTRATTIIGADTGLFNGNAGLSLIPNPLASVDPARRGWYYVAVVGVVCAAGYLVLRRFTTGPLGRALRAVRDDEDAAIAVGKNVVGLRLAVQAGGGGYARPRGAPLARLIGRSRLPARRAGPGEPGGIAQPGGWARAAGPAGLAAIIAVRAGAPLIPAVLGDGGRAPILIVDGLVKRYGGVHAVDGASFTAAAGSITGLIGPNGAGKSTVLGLVSGFVRPDAGRITFGGRDVAALPAHRPARLGIVRTFQLPREFRALTTIENLLVAAPGQRGESAAGVVAGRWMWRRDEDELAEAARGLLRLFGMAEAADQRAGRLSGGQKRLLEVMRGLMAKPPLLLLDEPMARPAPAPAERLGAARRQPAAARMAPPPRAA